MSVTGSSPLVRGQLGRSRRGFLFLRIIPARAGPTDSFGRVFLSFADHPRSCGANRFVRASFFIIRGSSPLVRGQLIGRAHLRHGLRIIPARAGPTDRSECISTMRSDHPRSCGANGHAGRHGRRLAGSSPLVRGQPDGAGDASRQTRIIPARAGPTASLMLAKVEGTDHPRSCGANAYRASDDTGPCGSSPLVRGQLQLQQDDTTKLRIIPARAGPT